MLGPHELGLGDPWGSGKRDGSFCDRRLGGGGGDCDSGEVVSMRLQWAAHKIDRVFQRAILVLRKCACSCVVLGCK